MSPDQLRDELSAKTLDELRELAEALRIPGSSSASKAQLIDRLLQADSAALSARLQAPASSNPGRDDPGVYHPAPWEKICAFTAALLAVLLVVVVVVRGQQITDQNVANWIQTLLCTAVAVLGATIPGFLNVDLSSRRGVSIRAGGALALFVLTYFFSPSASPVSPPPPPPPPPILKGYVIDAETSEQLPGVTLTIQDWDTRDGRTPTSTSDDAGRFRFEDLRPGPAQQQVRLIARKAGYQLSSEYAPLGATGYPIKLKPDTNSRDNP